MPMASRGKVERLRAPLQKVPESCSDRDGWPRWSYLGLISGRNWLISDIGCTLTDFLILGIRLDVINTMI